MGLPVFLTTQKKFETKSVEKLLKSPTLMFAQDTGKAIKGANRGDYFFGSGKIAGSKAGKTKFFAHTILLLPNN
jgi:membrane-bound lytic murein transglycosylase